MLLDGDIMLFDNHKLILCDGYIMIFTNGEMLIVHDDDIMILLHDGMLKYMVLIRY